MKKSDKAEVDARIYQSFVHAGLEHKSMKDLGSLIGVSQQAISKLLNGKQGLSSETGLKIAKLCDVNYDWLMTGRGGMVYAVHQGVDISPLSAKSKKMVTDLIAHLLKLEKASKRS